MIHKNASTPLSQQLFNLFAQRIRQQLLPPGSRLPSVRQCAQQHQVSASTVCTAYDQLQAHGLVQAKAGSGYFVRQLHNAQPNHVATPDPNQAAPLAFNATSLIRGLFRPASAQSQPGMGTLPSSWLQVPFLATALRKAMRDEPLFNASLQYGNPLGDDMLRSTLAAMLRTMDIPALPQHTITTIGATHALDVISRTLLKPGDSVMVDEPGWSVEFARLHALGMRVLPVPRTADGPDLAIMTQYCLQHAPKLYITVSVLHNPTGLSLTPAQGHQILQLAHQHDFYIAEDDTYSHFASHLCTRLASLDGLTRTIYVGGFAKILVPSWRVGYLVAPKKWVQPLLETKLISTLTTPALMERALAHCIEQGQLHRHAQQMRKRLDVARKRCTAHAQAAGYSLITPPAGLFAWVDTGRDTNVLAQRMLDFDIQIAPGSLFYAQQRSSTAMRINVAVGQDADMWQALLSSPTSETKAA